MIFLDIFLFLMIGICILYCWLLNRQIQDLQNSRIEFARMIKELNVSIVQAEKNIHDMSELSKVTAHEIRVLIADAKKTISDLLSTIATARGLLKELHSSEVTSKMTNNNPNHAIWSEEDTDKPQNSVRTNPDNTNNKFTEEDLLPIDDEPVSSRHTNHLKGFFANIISKKNNENLSGLSQTNYYNTLKKINTKK